MITLTNVTNFPPGGYIYREVTLSWVTTQNLAMEGLESVANAVRMLRLQNPASGLDPSYEACLEAVKAYTCARLNNDPRFCGESDVTVIAASTASKPTKKKKTCCGG